MSQQYIVITFLAIVGGTASNVSLMSCQDEAYMNDDYSMFYRWRREEILRQPFMSNHMPSHHAYGGSDSASGGRTVSSEEPPIAMIYPQLRTEGFFNQITSMYFYIQASLQSGRALVLPLMSESKQWDAFAAAGTVGPFPFLDYFDHSSLMRLLPIVEREDFARWCHNSTVLLTSLREESPEAFQEELALFSAHPQEKVDPNVRVLPSVVNLRPKDILFCQRDPESQCLSKAEFETAVLKVVRRSVSPAADVVPTCLALERHMIMDVDLGRKEFSDFGKGYQGHAITNEKFRRLFTALQPSLPLQCIAQLIMHEIGSTFNGMHVRRGDFRTFAEEMKLGGNGIAVSQRRKYDAKVFGVESIMQDDATLVKQVMTTLYMPLLPILIASDEPDHVRRVLTEASIPGLRVYVIKDFLHLFPAWMRKRNDLHLLVEQTLLVNASVFVGNRYSGVSAYVYKHRLLLNRPSVTF